MQGASDKEYESEEDDDAAGIHGTSGTHPSRDPSPKRNASLRAPNGRNPEPSGREAAYMTGP
jgi:hypothetical protein